MGVGYAGVGAAGVGDAGVGDAGVGAAGVGAAGVGAAGVGDAGVGDAGVGDAGVGAAGVGDAGMGDAGVGAAGAAAAGEGMAGRLTTHVLDTANGIPASGVAVTLLAASGGVLARATTNADGRLDAPILAGDAFRPGAYVLEFAAGDYFRRLGVVLPEPAFLDVVAIAFGIADPGAHYHVPLLVSPYGYATYRGS